MTKIVVVADVVEVGTEVTAETEDVTIVDLDQGPMKEEVETTKTVSIMIEETTDVIVAETTREIAMAETGSAMMIVGPMTATITIVVTEVADAETEDEIADVAEGMTIVTTIRMIETPRAKVAGKITTKSPTITLPEAKDVMTK